MPYTNDGLAAGKHDIAYHGEDRVYTNEVTITDYEAGGVPFDPVNVTGHSRVDFVDVYVADDSTTYMARFDHVNATLRLFDLSDGTEPADAATVDVPLRVRVEGSG